MVQSAGLLIYRGRGPQLEVLLVHPSGNYNRHKPWGIPKGLPDEGETIVQAAARETWEEAGVDLRGRAVAPEGGPAAVDQLVPLGHIDYTRSKKRVHAFAAEMPADAKPHPASWEIDRAEFFLLDEARRLMQPDQQPFLDRLVEMLAARG